MGIRYRFSEEDYDYRWDGKRMYFQPKDSVSDFCHELAHWLLATPRQRKLREYGLGAGPDTNDNSGANEHTIQTLYMPIEARRHLDNDAYASFLGITIEEYLGFSCKYTIYHHSWHETFLDTDSKLFEPNDMNNQFFFVLHKLTEWGCLRGNVPTALEFIKC
jgi:hypothetical protein